MINRMDQLPFAELLKWLYYAIWRTQRSWANSCKPSWLHGVCMIPYLEILGFPSSMNQSTLKPSGTIHKLRTPRTILRRMHISPRLQSRHPTDLSHSTKDSGISKILKHWYFEPIWLHKVPGAKNPWHREFGRIHYRSWESEKIHWMDLILWLTGTSPWGGLGVWMFSWM